MIGVHKVIMMVVVVVVVHLCSCILKDVDISLVPTLSHWGTVV